jgi:uncharacterized protein YdeI (YjbR/CyaY-like superfamily)
MEPIFFESPAAFREWLEANHESAAEVWVGLYKVQKGQTIPLSWSQAVDQALCFGWIDGIAKGIDDTRRKQRFTPRRKGSIWSAVNIKKVEVLTAQGLMHPKGLQAYAERKEEKSKVYSHEQGEVTLEPEQEATFRANGKAWDFFHTQAPSYRKAALWWVVSAKREETRQKRLATLIEDSANGRRLKHLTRGGT